MSCTTNFYKPLENQPTKEEVLAYCLKRCDDLIRFWTEYANGTARYKYSITYKKSVAKREAEAYTKLKQSYLDGTFTVDTELDCGDENAYRLISYNYDTGNKLYVGLSEIKKLYLRRLVGEIKECGFVKVEGSYEEGEFSIDEVDADYRRLCTEYDRIINGGDLNDSDIEYYSSKTKIINLFKRNGIYYKEVGQFYDAFRVLDYPEITLTSYDETIAYIESRKESVYTDDFTFDKLKQFFNEYPDGIISFC